MASEEYFKKLISLYRDENYSELFDIAVSLLEEEERSVFEVLAPMDYIISFVIIVVSKYYNQLGSNMNIIGVCCSLMRFNCTLPSLRNDVVILNRMVSQITDIFIIEQEENEENKEINQQLLKKMIGVFLNGLASLKKQHTLKTTILKPPNKIHINRPNQ
jgi:hypothetical protein